MTNDEQLIRETNGYEPLFSYGHLRGHYVGSDMTCGALHVEQFVRPEHLSALRETLVADHVVMSPSSDAAVQQRKAMPITRQCLWELQSGIMLRVLENITGLHNLLPDTRCKQTRIVFAPSEQPKIETWHDPDTGLDVALVLVIQLNNGDAEFSTNAKSLTEVVTSCTALQVSYWQHKFEMTGVSA
jgi:hypothetical protein